MDFTTYAHCSRQENVSFKLSDIITTVIATEEMQYRTLDISEYGVPSISIFLNEDQVKQLYEELKRAIEG